MAKKHTWHVESVSEDPNYIKSHHEEFFELFQFGPAFSVAGFPVYNSQSLVALTRGGAFIVPQQPSLVMTDKLILLDESTNRTKRFSDVIVLTFHAVSEGDVWHQKFEPKKSVFEILRALEKTSIDIAFLYVCNQANVEFQPNHNLRKKYLYSFGKPTGSFYFDGEKIIMNLKCPKLIKKN